MVENRSPWLEGLKRERPLTKLNDDLQTDIAIVGGGIAGISTAYFLLEETDKSVAVLEKGLVGHGATGHNGGQVVAAFERTFLELAEEFAEEEVAQAHHELAGAWTLLWKIIEASGIEERPTETIAHLGFSSIEDVLLLLEEKRIREKYGVPFGTIAVSNDVIGLIPQRKQEGLKTVSRHDIMQLLGTKDDRYCCILDGRVGVMNSAAFTEQLATYLCRRYKNRFAVFENTAVHEIVIGNRAILSTDEAAVNAGRAVLCTNGYKDYRVRGIRSIEPVTSVVGFQTGYWRRKVPTTEVSVFFAVSRSRHEGEYFYLTKRAFNRGELSSLGGPEWEIAGPYEGPDPKSAAAYEELDEFYDRSISSDQERDYAWQGLMGYSQNGTRIVGADPQNDILLYNLACNGIGLLPSIYGAKNITEIVLGTKRPPAIFAPRKAVESKTL